MLRITAIGAGAVDYLLKGCAPAPEPTAELDLDRDGQPQAGDGAPGLQGHTHEGPGAYFSRAIEHGEPAGVWLGSGMEGLGLAPRAGDTALDADVRAVFGQLRRPESTERDPVYIGQRPREYKSGDERLNALLEKEPGAAPERIRELELQAASNGRRGVAYYDFTLSPVKSISVYYAALIAGGLTEEADAVRAAHDEAVKIAIDYAEQHVAYTRVGYHGSNGHGGSVGEFVRGTGLSVIAFGHSTSRESEPQLHTHAGVLNRLGTADGHIGALDSKGFRAIKEGVATAYERAVEQLVTEATGAVFTARPDGKAREIDGVDPELCAEASTRRGQVTERVAELIAAYKQRHGDEPDAAARKAMSQAAVFDTRRPKDSLSGPAGVAAWGQAHRAWCEAVIDEVDAAALAAVARPHASARGVTGHEPVAADRDREEWLSAALTAGVADVQAQYATWTLGNLMHAIDCHLGDAGRVGVPAAARPALVEDLARRAVEPGSGCGVVQLTGHEPVPVPDSLRRIGPGEDGRPRFRPHMDERYATSSHLALEEHVVARSRERNAPHLALDAREVLTRELEAAGLSEDQVTAVVGVLSSGHGGDVLVGPAGAGKSCTVGAVAAAWTSHVAGPGGRVFGVATSQVATANLAGDGLTAINTTRFLAATKPDNTGTVRLHLGPSDLVVVDEAGMSSTTDLEQITSLVTDAGGKVLFTGDPAQLDAVDAGGLFAYLAEHGDPDQVYALEQVHRFRAPWERDASLGLRAGDHAAIHEYADRGRLTSGSLEEMQEAASCGYLADTLGGRSSLLIVGTNQHAAELSAAIRDRLIEVGVVAPERLVTLADDNAASAGDVIQARRNDVHLRVDPAVGAVALPVTNRERYTVLGRGPGGAVLGRDRLGGIAHLTEDYLGKHASLGYAVTIHGAQGVNVDTAHPLLDRDATREATYVAATRGRDANLLYLVTERDPDEHQSQRIDERTVERLASILDSPATQPAAARVRDDADAELASLPAVAARFDVVSAQAARDRHTEQLFVALGERDSIRVMGDGGGDRLLRTLREAELAGHDTRALLGKVSEASLGDAESVADVLRWRIRTSEARRTPEREVDPADWTTWMPAPDGNEPTATEIYLQRVAQLASRRQAALGAEVAAQQPQWALDSLGPVPDRGAERDAWQRRAGAVAACRELAGVPDDQASLGAAPSREREFHRALWRHAADAVGRGSGATGRDWREVNDDELYRTREQWVRELDTAPAWVAEQLADTHRLAREYAADAALGQARLRQEVDPERSRELSETLDRDERFVAHLTEQAAELEAAHKTRQQWWADKTPAREADQAAADELARRALPPVRDPDVEWSRPVPEPDAASPGSVSGLQLDTDEPDVREPTSDAVEACRERTEPNSSNSGVDDAEVHAVVFARWSQHREPATEVRFGSREWAALDDDTPAKRAATTAAAMRVWNQGGEPLDQDLDEVYERLRTHDLEEPPEPVDTETVVATHWWSTPHLEVQAPTFGSRQWVALPDGPEKDAGEAQAALRWFNGGDSLDAMRQRADEADEAARREAIAEARAKGRPVYERGVDPPIRAQLEEDLEQEPEPAPGEIPVDRSRYAGMLEEAARQRDAADARREREEAQDAAKVTKPEPEPVTVDEQGPVVDEPEPVVCAPEPQSATARPDPERSPEPPASEADTDRDLAQLHLAEAREAARAATLGRARQDAERDAATQLSGHVPEERQRRDPERLDAAECAREEAARREPALSEPELEVD